MRSLLGRFHRPMSRGLVNNMLTMNNLGDGSTLSLDFTTMGGVLDPRLTFTRASTVATYINSSGYVATATTNEPRFDYSPTNIGDPRGLLVEGQTANVCPQSQALTTGWLNANMSTPTNPAIADPFGGTSATWKLVAPISASALRGWRHAVVTLTAANYTFSFWAKAAEFDRIVLGDPGSGRGGCKFVLVGNGTATVIPGSTTPTNPTIELFPGGWYRCSVTMLMLASTYAMGIAGYPAATTPNEYGPTYVQTNLDGVYATGFQIELGSGASSYIPTGASQVTRNVDNCYMNDISSLSYSTTNGTLFYESLTTKWNISSYPARLGFTKETGDYRAFGALTDIGGMLPNVGGPAGTPTVLVSLPFTLNTNTKCAWSFDAALSTAELQATINGGAIVNSTASALTVSETPTYFGLGQKGYDLYLPCGPVKRVKYWPTTLTAAQLQTLTAP